MKNFSNPYWTGTTYALKMLPKEKMGREASIPTKPVRNKKLLSNASGGEYIAACRSLAGVRCGLAKPLSAERTTSVVISITDRPCCLGDKGH
jgi:hypothetical protein